jgi:formylglycine-generating enzyme required for sulfatase activity
LMFLADVVRDDPALADEHVPCNGDGEPYWEWSGDRFLRASVGMLGAAHSEIVTWPVFGISLKSAEAYAAWKSSRTGKTYRLPTEAEWEKAARGIDGRSYPWGDAFDATFCKMRESRSGRARPERPGAFSSDESPFGVRDMAGGIAEWTAPVRAATDTHEQETVTQDATRVAVKGGAWCDWAADCDLGGRRLYSASERAARVGFRLARSVEVPL